MEPGSEPVARDSMGHSRAGLEVVGGRHLVAMVEAADSYQDDAVADRDRRPVEDPSHVSTWLQLHLRLKVHTG